MELDTGAAYSVITYQRIVQQKGVPDLAPSDLKLTVAS